MISLALEFLPGKTADYTVLSRDSGASDCRMKGRLAIM
jgi:hypothetical protein